MNISIRLGRTGRFQSGRRFDPRGFLGCIPAGLLRAFHRPQAP